MNSSNIKTTVIVIVTPLSAETVVSGFFTVWQCILTVGDSSHNVLTTQNVAFTCPFNAEYTWAFKNNGSFSCYVTAILAIASSEVQLISNVTSCKKCSKMLITLYNVASYNKVMMLWIWTHTITIFTAYVYAYFDTILLLKAYLYALLHTIIRTVANTVDCRNIIQHSFFQTYYCIHSLCTCLFYYYGAKKSVRYIYEFAI